MGFWDWVGRKISAEQIGGWNILPWQANKAYHPSIDYRELVKRYSSWVYTCASKNAISCAQTPLRLYSGKPTSQSKSIFHTRQLEPIEKTRLLKSPTIQKYALKAADVEEVLDHPFLDMFTGVNNYMNQFDLLEGMFLAQELVGNAYWVMLKSQLGIPEQIWPLMPQYVKIIPDKQKFISHYEFYISKTEIHRIEPEDLIHFKYVNPSDPYYGLSPLQACVVAADLSNSMNSYETNLFRNGARPDIALVLPPETVVPSEEEQKRIKKSWFKRHGGVGNAGNMAVLTGGAELKPVSLSPKEMAFLQGRKATLKEIAGVFGVPLSKVSTEDVNRANAEAGDYSYMKDTILPRLRKAEQKINEQLMPLYPQSVGGSLFVAFDNPVPQDKEFRIKERESNLKNGYTSINQERERDGQEAVMWGEIPLLSMNIAPLGTQPTESIIEPQEAKSKAPRRFPPVGHPTNFVNEGFELAMTELFREIEADFLAKWDSEFTKNVKMLPGDLVSGWFDGEVWAKQLFEKAEPFIEATVVTGGKRVLAQLESPMVIDSRTPGVLRAVDSRKNTLKQTSATTAKEIRDTIAGGLDANETTVDIRKRLVGEFEYMKRTRATVISRTETIWAWNEGAEVAYITSGVVEGKEWLISADDRNCQWCPEMDGKTMGLGENYFSMGSEFEGNRGGKLLFDYEEIRHPPLHPQCRCTLIPIVKEF